MLESIHQSSCQPIAEKLLDLAVIKQKAIASNIANVETPGYKRLQVENSFEQQLLKQLKEAPQGAKMMPLELVKDTQTQATRPDGNNVTLESEMMHMNKNALEYEFLTQVMSNNFREIHTAITGRSS